MKKRVVVVLAAALASCVALSGCSFNPGNFEVPSVSEITSEAGSVVPVSSETASDSGWEKPSASSSEKTTETGGKDAKSYEYDFDAHNPDEWQVAYKKKLEELCVSVPGGDEEDFLSEKMYFLADIDDAYGEYLPELCVRFGTCEADYNLVIYTYDTKKKEVIELVGQDRINAGHSEFFVGPNGDLYSYAGHMGYLWVTHYSNLSGKLEEEMVFEQDLNGDPDPEAQYKPMSEIIGDEVNACVYYLATDPAPLIWYLNIPVSTACGNPDEADEAITKCLYENAEVYVVNGEYYSDCKTGLMPFHDLKKEGVFDEYTKGDFVMCTYCYTDVNFDGQDEMLIKYGLDQKDTSGSYHFTYVLLSYQNGGVYAYVFPYLGIMEQSVEVCHYDVYHNWYLPEANQYVGFNFDQDRCVLFYADVNEEPEEPVEANVWKTFRVDFGY